jgi:hypothetical protein
LALWGIKLCIWFYKIDVTLYIFLNYNSRFNNFVLLLVVEQTIHVFAPNYCVYYQLVESCIFTFLLLLLQLQLKFIFMDYWNLFRRTVILVWIVLQLKKKHLVLVFRQAVIIFLWRAFMRRKFDSAPLAGRSPSAWTLGIVFQRWVLIGIWRHKMLVGLIESVLVRLP